MLLHFIASAVFLWNASEASDQVYRVYYQAYTCQPGAPYCQPPEWKFIDIPARSIEISGSAWKICLRVQVLKPVQGSLSDENCVTKFPSSVTLK